MVILQGQVKVHLLSYTRLGIKIILIILIENLKFPDIQGTCTNLLTLKIHVLHIVTAHVH